MEFSAFQGQKIRSCEHCPVRKHAFCARCSPKEITGLGTLRKFKTFKRGDVVKSAGQGMSYFASVVSGSAGLSKITEDGKNQIVGLLLPSDFFGYPNGNQETKTVTALSDLTICCLDFRDFGQVLDQTPRISQQMLEMTLNDLEAARDWLVVLGRKNALERVASLLVATACRTAEISETRDGRQMRIDLGMTRTNMADLLGLSVETVSRQMTRLEDEGLIGRCCGPKVVVREFESLACLAKG